MPGKSATSAGDGPDLFGAGLNSGQGGSARVETRVAGLEIFQGYLDETGQADMLAELRPVLEAVPPIAQSTPSGKPMSVRMTAAGTLGWISDSRGYRYEGSRPGGPPWPPIPETVLEVWRALADDTRVPDCCLVNHYGEGARMGMHQDRDEKDFSWPVLSISLGDDALFRVGGTRRGGPTSSYWLKSGDVVVMGGDGRLAYHGVDRIRFGSSSLLPEGGRLNLTLRVVT